MCNSSFLNHMLSTYSACSIMCNLNSRLYTQRLSTTTTRAERQRMVWWCIRRSMSSITFSSSTITVDGERAWHPESCRRRAGPVTVF